MKTINYSKNKLNAKIIEHFETIGVFEYSESKYNSKEIKDEFEIEFKDVDLNETGNYEFLIIYNLNCKPVIDFENSHVYKIKEGDYSEEVELKLKTTNFNPNKESLYDIIQDIVNKQDKTDKENERSAKDIEDTNNILNQKYR